MDTDEPRPIPPERPRKGPTSFGRQLALAMEVPFILAGGTVIGGLLGHWIDLHVHTWPLFTFVLGLLGLVAGVREILRRIPKDDNDSGR